MTIIAALNIKKIYGLPINEVLLAGDSRVTNDVPRTKLNAEKRKDESFVISQFDSVQKVIPVAPNVLIGIAGDYQTINIVNNLKDYLSETDPSGKERYQRSLSFLKTEIKNFISENFFKNSLTNTHFLLVIKDFKSNVKRLFKLVLPSDIFVSLDEGLHVIGDSAKTRAIFKQEFEFNKNEIFKYNQGKNIIHILSTTLGVTFEGVKSEGVGGRFHCFLMSNNGWVNIGSAQLFEEQNLALATAMGKDGISTQLNGVNVELLTSDWNIVDDHLKKNFKSVMKFNNKKSQQ